MDRQDCQGENQADRIDFFFSFFFWSKKIILIQAMNSVTKTGFLNRPGYAKQYAGLCFSYEQFLDDKHFLYITI